MNRLVFLVKERIHICISTGYGAWYRITPDGITYPLLFTC